MAAAGVLMKCGRRQLRAAVQEFNNIKLSSNNMRFACHVAILLCILGIIYIYVIIISMNYANYITN
jgi:hypothetical protein